MHAALMIVRSVLLALCSSALWFYYYSTYSALCFFSRRPRIDPDFHPPITILKPIRGLDREGYANLASFCRQDYPEYQVVFGVHDERDPAVEVAKQIIKDFPGVDIRLVVSDRTVGTNPKVNNLANMEAEAKHSILLLSDSDIRVGPDYLMSVVQPMRDPAVGVVTCLYRSRARGLAAVIEAVGISTEFHPGVLVARKIEGMTFALGAGILIRRAVLEAVGGFAAVADYLADDFLLGNLPARAGYVVQLSSYVVEHTLDTGSFPELVRHQMRWARGTRVSRPWGYVGLIFTQGTATSLLFLLVTAGSAFGWAVFAATELARLAMGWVIGARCLHDQAAKRFLWLAPLRDLLGFALWCYSFTGDTIEWRGRRFRLANGGKLIPYGVG